jgi:hypothetical protein
VCILCHLPASRIKFGILAPSGIAFANNTVRLLKLVAGIKATGFLYCTP